MCIKYIKHHYEFDRLEEFAIDEHLHAAHENIRWCVWRAVLCKPVLFDEAIFFKPKINIKIGT